MGNGNANGASPSSDQPQGCKTQSWFLSMPPFSLLSPVQTESLQARCPTFFRILRVSRILAGRPKNLKGRACVTCVTFLLRPRRPQRVSATAPIAFQDEGVAERIGFSMGCVKSHGLSAKARAVSKEILIGGGRCHFVALPSCIRHLPVLAFRPAQHLPALQQVGCRLRGDCSSPGDGAS